MTSLRIGTWNVEHAAGADKNAARLDRLLEQDCDVWVLTETHDDLVLDGYAPLSTVQRPGTPRHGARWTTLWSRIGTPRRLETVDPVRTVCAEIDGVVVFGTVLPWQHDPGPGPGEARGWSEFLRVAADQSQEWRQLRAARPDCALVVAGDLNHSLSGMCSG